LSIKLGGRAADAGSVRATRGVFGALGAGTMLAIASSVALLVVSSVVAFRGWPGAPSEPGVDNARLVGPSPDSRGAVPASVTLPRATASSAPREKVRRAAEDAGSRTSRPASSTAQAASTAQPVYSSSSSTAPATRQPSRESAAGQTVAKVGRQAGDAVSKTTQAAGQAVAPVAPPVGRTLEDLGAAAGSTVQQVAGAAGKTLP
jgi:hypothetical protein